MIPSFSRPTFSTPALSASALSPIALGALLTLLSATAAKAEDSPMIDGKCSEYARQVPIADERATVWIADTPTDVFLCFDLPEGSVAAAELTLETPLVSEKVTLHISAQLGEWPHSTPDARPRLPDSDLWWNNQDWTATPLRFGGMTEFEGEAEPRFRPGTDLELQLRKSRFGAGQWELGGTLFAVGNAGGPPASLSLDHDGESLSVTICAGSNAG